MASQAKLAEGPPQEVQSKIKKGLTVTAQKHDGRGKHVCSHPGFFALEKWEFVCGDINLLTLDIDVEENTRK